jgi:hypothetical protein
MIAKYSTRLLCSRDPMSRSARLDLKLRPLIRNQAGATATFESRKDEPQARWQALPPLQDPDDAGFGPDVRSLGIAELLHTMLHGIAATLGNSLVLLDSVFVPHSVPHRVQAILRHSLQEPVQHRLQHPVQHRVLPRRRKI